MKKIIAILLALFLATPVFAQGDTHAKVIYTVMIYNDSGYAYKLTAIPTTTIRPKIDKVIGYGIQKYDVLLSAEAIIGVFDDTTATNTGECMAEDEADEHLSKTVYFPFPRKIENGVVVNQGHNTLATIYFIRE